VASGVEGPWGFPWGREFKEVKINNNREGEAKERDQKVRRKKERKGLGQQRPRPISKN